MFSREGAQGICIGKFPNLHLLRALGYDLAMGFSSINLQFPHGFLEGIFEISCNHGKKQLRTASAII